MSLVKDILLGAVNEQVRSQTMLTLSKVDNGDGKRRELWLVPLRSIKKTLAVLLVHVAVDRSEQYVSPHAVSGNLDPPQAIVSHFAAVFAPVLYAATVVETQKAKEKEYEKTKEMYARLVKEVSLIICAFIHTNIRERIIFCFHTNRLRKKNDI